MANILKKFKTMIGLDDEFYDDEEEGYYEDSKNYESRESEVNNSYESSSFKDNSDVSDSYDRIKRSNIINFKETAGSDRVKITIHEPITYEDAPNLLDDILARRVAVLNLEMLEIDKKRQIFDFVSGGIYALDGKIQKVTKDIFVIAPKGIEIDGKIKDQIQSKGFYQL